MIMKYYLALKNNNLKAINYLCDKNSGKNITNKLEIFF